MEDVDENLTCRVCLGLFDDGAHRPLLLPACGHTFCAFCIDNLFKQAKQSCPECRKARAVNAVSSLPVNYSLLSLVQARRRIATVNMSQQSPPVVRARASCSSELCGSAQRSGEIPHSTHNPQPPQGASQIPFTVKKLAINPSSKKKLLRGYSNQRRLLQQSQGRYCATSSSSMELMNNQDGRTLQEELDFQMAVHLTFCKDASHNHDDPGQSFRCWQYPDDDELFTALSMSQK